MTKRTLVIGSSGQIGTELVTELRKLNGVDNVIASDLRAPQVEEEGHFLSLDVLDKAELLAMVKDWNVGEIYLMAALLSATAEEKPDLAWDLNMNGLFNVLELAKEGIISKVFWPSSIAVFGPTTPKENTPQRTIMEPNTIYGISKLAGERWCEYYHEKYGVDVRGVRYPGLIGHRSVPGGGTTDYAVHIFHEALAKGEYTSFLAEHTRLPMMYMPDAIRATIGILEAPAEQVKIRSSYNIAGCSFHPKEIAQEVQRHLPDFKMNYAPDHRQAFADGWPSSIDDSVTHADWGWRAEFDLPKMVDDMMAALQQPKLG